MRTFSPSLIALSLVFAVGLPLAQADEPAPENVPPPLYADGPYGAVMGRFLKTDGSNPMDFGFGGTIGAGMRRGPVALEINGSYTAMKHSASLRGGAVNGLVFPFQKSLPGLFGIVGVGVTNVDKYPGLGDTTFNVTTVDGGAGYLLPLHFNRYQFGLRMQAMYEYGKRQKRAQDQRPPTIDLPVESNFHDLIANVGFQFPFGLEAVPAPVPEPPVTVVPPVAEAPPPPPKPECKKPEPGEKITLDGCGTGDVIVLNGVNFDFNKATLTANAKTILDPVSGELTSHADIQVELSGHTDGRGSEDYNLKLSQKRAEAVRSYFIAHGIAAERMTAVGYGKTQPIASNDTDEGRERNRRVELKITAGGGGTPVTVPTGAPDAAPAADTAPPH